MTGRAITSTLCDRDAERQAVDANVKKTADYETKDCEDCGYENSHAGSPFLNECFDARVLFFAIACCMSSIPWVGFEFCYQITQIRLNYHYIIT